MKTVRYLILGAGPSGLTLAHALLDRGVPRDQLLVLEKEQVAGGLCRSAEVDGAPLDIGGGHFLDLARPQVLDLLFRFLPEQEWASYDRVSKIRLRGQQIDHPLEANLWRFSTADQVDYLESIAKAGCVRGEPMPEAFADWVAWKLGERIASEYMLPYNRKIWSLDPNELGTYWLHKLPDVSFRDTLRACLEGRPCGKLPAHGRFLYPKAHGYGEVWRRMGEALGESLLTDCPLRSIDLDTRLVNGLWRAETILSTIPWVQWPAICRLPDAVRADIGLLRSVAIDVDYAPDTLADSSHWIYEPDEAIAYHRLLLRFNFCAGSRGHWTETNASRSVRATGWRHRNEFAYPLNTHGKPEAVARLRQWAAGRGVIGIGRWGKWEHMNSDVAVADALAAVDSYCANGRWP